MIRDATYTNGIHTATIHVERIDTWIASTEGVINFPGLVELDDHHLYMTIHRGRHGGTEPIQSLHSSDDGLSWHDASPDSAFIAKHPENDLNYLDFTSGTLGYLRDGTIARIDTYPVEIEEATVGYTRNHGPFHEVMQIPNPTFRWRRWSSTGESLEVTTFHIDDLPWATSSYENYGSVVELKNGGLLASFLRVYPCPGQEGIATAVFIGRSDDDGKSWQLATVFDPDQVDQTYGISDRHVDQGFSEPDLTLLSNGDVLCVIRTGSYSPMWQSRSVDGGVTWAPPTRVGWPGVRPQLDTLPNGILTCTTGRGGYGQPQVTGVLLSLDGTGTHWEAPFNFHTGPGCSYTQTMQRSGNLHVIYSHSDFTRVFGTHALPSQTIKRAILNVRLETGYL